MASGSGSGGGGGRSLGVLLDAMLRGRVNRSGGSEMSPREFYQELRRMGASREEARRYTKIHMANTTAR